MHARLTVLALALAASCPPAFCAPALDVVAKIAIGGAARWNYMLVDSERHRLYLAHDTQTEVIDTRSNRSLGTVNDTPGARAIAIAPDLGVGYTSNGAADTVTVFDLATLARTATIPVGSGPDAIVYAPRQQRVLVFNAHSHDVSVIDARAGTVIRTEPLGGEPETAVLGRDGLVHLNLENTNEMIVFDPGTMIVTSRHSLLPCRRPTALAIDGDGSFHSACRNGLVVVTSADGRVVGNAPIGRGSDGVAWLDGLSYSADGGDGTLSIVGRRPNGDWATLATVPTSVGSRTLAVDPSQKRLYLPTARFTPVAGNARPMPVPDSLTIWVLEPR